MAVTTRRHRRLVANQRHQQQPTRFRLGNDWRLVVEVFYPAKVLYVKFIGAHAEYDNDAAKVDY